MRGLVGWWQCRENLQVKRRHFCLPCGGSKCFITHIGLVYCKNRQPHHSSTTYLVMLEFFQASGLNYIKNNNSIQRLRLSLFRKFSITRTKSVCTLMCVWGLTLRSRPLLVPRKTTVWFCTLSTETELRPGYSSRGMALRGLCNASGCCRWAAPQSSCSGCN